MSSFNKISSTRILVTPEIAKEFLASSLGNRGIRRSKVDAFREAMLSGEWIENGDSIRFYDDGTLQDGHHRLTACIQAGIPFQAILVHGLTKDAAKTVDKGSARSNADELSLHSGLTPDNARIAASVASILIIHDMGSSAWARPGGSHSKHLTATRVTKWVEENMEEIRPAIEWSKTAIKKGNTMLPKSNAAALLILGSRIDEDLAKEFLDAVFSGYGITPGSTADHVRTALLAAAMGAKKIDRSTRVLTVAKAMKSYLAGRTIKHAGNAMFKPSDAVPMFPLDAKDQEA